MQKIYLMLLLMPIFSMASDRASTSMHAKKVIRLGVAVMIDHKNWEKAGDIRGKYYMNDVAWLKMALDSEARKRIKPDTPMLCVHIADEKGSRRYWHHHMAFKDPNNKGNEIFFPHWLPRVWFTYARNGVVRTPKLFGLRYRILLPEPELEEGEIVDVLDD